jgi:mannosyltransferase OCH1-like enzyme
MTLKNPRQVNNAQMASVPGHPFWLRFARAMTHKAREGNTHPLEATGPALLTRVFQVGGMRGGTSQ